MNSEIRIFSQRVKNLRKSRKFTQAGLAEQLGLTDRQVSSYENGQAYPTAPGLIKLANIFDTTTDYLLGLTDNPTRDPSYVSPLNATEQELHDLIASFDEDYQQKLLAAIKILSS